MSTYPLSTLPSSPLPLPPPPPPLQVDCYKLSLLPLKAAVEEQMKKLQEALVASLRRKVGGSWGEQMKKLQEALVASLMRKVGGSWGEQMKMLQEALVASLRRKVGGSWGRSWGEADGYVGAEKNIHPIGSWFQFQGDPWWSV